MPGRKVFLDVGGHTGESLMVAMDPRWQFDRIWTFEPTSTCLQALVALADDRVEIVHAGLWSSATLMDIHDPGALHASIDPSASRRGEVERCQFLDAAAWMAKHITEDDTVWMKVNVEAAEVAILGRLLDSGEIHKVDHLVIHFDVEKVGRGDEAVGMRARLDASGIAWREAREVMFGRTDSAKVDTWLSFTHNQRRTFLRQKTEHRARAAVWALRKPLRHRGGE